jgi:UDP-N-acetylmuramyl pentapeptide synthase
MKALVIDLTHGGVDISIELSKMGLNKIYTYDIYNTLKEEDETLLKSHNIILLKDLNEFRKLIKDEDFNEKFFIISPVHCYLTPKDIVEKDIEKFTFLNHHEAVKLILDKWNMKRNELKIPLIEVTGVKGKTSTVFLLKEILETKNKNLLLLSSLGALLFKDGKKIILKNNISITPASILKTIKLSKMIDNPKCNILPPKINLEESYNFNYDAIIWESSLGVTGLGDVGILTNLIENYPIAKNTSNAKEAKKQIFNCKIVVIDYETLNKYYFDEYEKFGYKINSFSMNPEEVNSNVVAKSIKYSLNSTLMEIEYNNLKTTHGNIIKGNITIETFAPGKHNVLNVLATLTACLSLNINHDCIIKGLKNFKGIDGRTSKKIIKNSLIFEEINPGLNVKAIKSSIDMVKNLNNFIIIIGGKYGVTCEEINEIELAKLLNKEINDNEIDLIFTDELGLNLKEKMKCKIPYYEDYNEIINSCIENEKNILFIYRSKYSDLTKR